MKSEENVWHFDTSFHSWFFWVALENDARIAVSRLAFPFLNRVQVSICWLGKNEQFLIMKWKCVVCVKQRVLWLCTFWKGTNYLHLDCYLCLSFIFKMKKSRNKKLCITVGWTFVKSWIPFNANVFFVLQMSIEWKR